MLGLTNANPLLIANMVNRINRIYYELVKTILFSLEVRTNNNIMNEKIWKDSIKYKFIQYSLFTIIWPIAKFNDCH